MTWTFQNEILAQGQVHQYMALSKGQPLSYGDALQHLQTDPSFRTALNQTLADAPFPAFFWETPPITQATVQQQPFEFVLVNSPQLATVRPDPNPFVDYFEQSPICPGIVTFPNLRGDAQLVVPCPDSDAKTDINAYPHIAAFVRQAPEDQQQAFWQAIGKVAVACLGDRSRPLWISTSGLGVYWLHIRLDDRPKYYNFADYKRWPQ